MVFLSLGGAAVSLPTIDAKPASIVCGNGTEFRCKTVFYWSYNQQVELDFIQPGKPTKSAFVEGLNGKSQDGCLNRQQHKN